MCINQLVHEYENIVTLEMISGDHHGNSGN